ncbi:hypothetical protein F5050DRAFT_683481 [Lentinula boryana]|uniref:Uncharacterized protein n=1 Tax=Lentinula boryana TaxID=40481 RepID=A0ABQ8Q4I1_9AGAR|nr:hypothetical protein F5050DRAFT_683481 [Lentinula boryana]
MDAPAKRDWPPVRGIQKETADTSQEVSVTNASSLKRAREQRSEDTSEHAGHSGYSQSLSRLVSTQPSRKGKEFITEDEIEESPVDRHKPREADRRDVEPLFTQPTQMVQSSEILGDDDSSGEETGENDLEEEGADEDDETETTKPEHRAQRYADDDNDEPLFTQISSSQLQSQQSHPTSPPRSPSRDPTVASASSSSGSGDEFPSDPDPDPSPTSHSEFPMPHPFDMSDSDSQSQYHSPQNPLRQIHPFDMPDAQQQPSTPLVSKTLEHHHPGDIEPPLVSNEAAESVIKALNAFITEMDHSRRTIERNGRAHRAGKVTREASPIQSSREELRLSVDMADVATSRERIQASVVRARGSPVPIGVKKQQQQQVNGRGTGDIHSPHHDNRLNNKATGAQSSDLGNSSAAATNSLPVASRLGFETSTQDADLNQRITNRPLYGFFSSSSSPTASGPSIISTDKGKNIAIEEGVTVNDPYREEPAQSTSRRSSKQIDLRKLQRAHFRKSSLPTVRNPTSNVKTPASSYAAPDIDERTTHKSSPFSASSSNSLRVGGYQHSPHSPLKLSFSDQSRLIEQTIQNMSQEYHFPPDYVRRVWKEAGDLDEAAAILGQLRDMAGILLRKASGRRSSGVDMESSAGPERTNSGSVSIKVEGSPPTGVDPNTILRNRLSNHQSNHSGAR